MLRPSMAHDEEEDDDEEDDDIDNAEHDQEDEDERTSVLCGQGYGWWHQDGGKE